VLYTVLKYLIILKEYAMRAGLTGILMGVSVAISLRNEKRLTSQVITLSLLTELLTIVILGVIDIS